MTIISTHRLHTYKTSASIRRDISPKKVPFQTYKYNKNSNNNLDLAMLVKTLKKNLPITPAVTTTVPTFGQINYKMTNSDIWCYKNQTLQMLINDYSLPEDDMWLDETLTSDEDVELAWSHLDYLEWLYD